MPRLTIDVLGKLAEKSRRPEQGLTMIMFCQIAEIDTFSTLRAFQDFLTRELGKPSTTETQTQWDTDSFIVRGFLYHKKYYVTVQSKAVAPVQQRMF